MLEKLLLTAIRAAREAGEAVLKVYGSDFDVAAKSDKTPLTLADRKSHDIIKSHLRTSDIPVLSEEGKAIPYETRRKWNVFWLVDPLDGTKEFVKKNGEFTINIALVESQRPVMGVVYVPVQDRLYWAMQNLGSFVLKKDSAVRGLESISGLKSQSYPLPLSTIKDRPRAYTVVGSRSHANAELEAYVAEKRREHGQVDFISAGSSLKFCLVAEGKADVYPRLGPTMEWDTAAGQAVTEGAGFHVVNFETGDPLIYNKEDLLNPWFLVTI